MKKLLLIAALMAVAGGSVRAADKWELVWSDEFNYEGLPDKTKWVYEEGFVRNHEKQYYTKGRLENARVENGMLVIECRKDHFKPANHAPVEYTSASIMTRGKTNFEYGRIEMRAKIPRGKGTWPAFWTVGADRAHVDWPFCGEIDIMEFIGRDPNHIYGTMHFARDGKHAKDGGKIETEKPYDDFHIYAIEWNPERIDFFFDDKKYHTVLLDTIARGADNPFRRPHYLKLNYALGGDWGGEIDDSTLPQKFLIDYVRVYKPIKN